MPLLLGTNVLGKVRGDPDNLHDGIQREWAHALIVHISVKTWVRNLLLVADLRWFCDNRTVVEGNHLQYLLWLCHLHVALGISGFPENTMTSNVVL